MSVNHPISVVLAYHCRSATPVASTTASVSALPDRNRERLPLPDEYDKALPARHPRVDEVPLEHRVVLSAERDHDGWVFRALALVDCGRIGKHRFKSTLSSPSSISMPDTTPRSPL